MDTLGPLDSTPSEAYVIGAVLSDSLLFVEYGHFLSADMFQNGIYRGIWQAFGELHARGETLDLGTFVITYPSLTGQLGVHRLATIQQSYAGAHDARKHAERIVEMHVRRMIAHGAQALKDSVWDMSQSVDELKSAYETIALGFSQVASGDGLRNGMREASAWYKDVESRCSDPSKAWGMVTGWTDLDQETLGWQRGDLIIVGGRTSVGKTAFAIENLIRIDNAGYKVGIFSLEMSKRQVQDRIGANMADVNLSKMRTGSCTTAEQRRLDQQKTLIAKISIDDARSVSTDYIVGEMKRRKRLEGLDFVVVDYLQEVIEPHEAQDNTGSALGRIARKLRKAAKDCDCAVLALSQLSRDAEGKKPKVSDLSGSAGLESAADVILLLHRDKKESPKLLEVDIAKQRNGPTGGVNLEYEPTRQRIKGIRDTFRPA